MSWTEDFLKKKRPAYWKGEPVYLRFGLWSARSKNWFTGEQEKGLSVYRATVKDGILTPEDEICYMCEGRLAFPVTGEEVGRGSDGEPLLRNVKLLKLAIDYREMPAFIKCPRQGEGGVARLS